MDAGPYSGPQIHLAGLGTSMTSQPDQHSLGAGHGVEVAFEYKRGSDEHGIAFAILDSSTDWVRQGYAGYEHAPFQTSAVVGFRNAPNELYLRVSCSHSSWTDISTNSYFYEPYGAAWGSVVYGASDQWRTITYRSWDDGQGNWKFWMHNGSGGTMTNTISHGFPAGNHGGPQSVRVQEGGSKTHAPHGGWLYLDPVHRIDPVQDPLLDPRSQGQKEGEGGHSDGVPNAGQGEGALVSADIGPDDAGGAGGTHVTASPVSTIRPSEISRIPK